MYCQDQVYRKSLQIVREKEKEKVEQNKNKSRVSDLEQSFPDVTPLDEILPHLTAYRQVSLRASERWFSCCFFSLTLPSLVSLSP